MAKRKGVLGKIAEAVSDAVQAAGSGTADGAAAAEGQVVKVPRKAKQKAAIARAEKAEQGLRDGRADLFRQARSKQPPVE